MDIGNHKRGGVAAAARRRPHQSTRKARKAHRKTWAIIMAATVRMFAPVARRNEWK